MGFGIPSKTNPEEITAEFELCWQCLEKMEPNSAEQEKQCKAAMNDFAQKYSSVKVEKTGFPLNSNHFKAIKQLKNNKELVITRPDKGNGVVLLDRSDYVQKMSTILKTEKFIEIGYADKHDRTLQVERALQAFLLCAVKKGDLSLEVYERIRPVGTRDRGCMAFQKYTSLVRSYDQSCR